jgi:hypothetical protein
LQIFVNEILATAGQAELETLARLVDDFCTLAIESQDEEVQQDMWRTALCYAESITRDCYLQLHNPELLETWMRRKSDIAQRAKMPNFREMSTSQLNATSPESTR